MDDQTTPRLPSRSFDAAALKALSHPLRVRIYDRLSQGPSTATALARRFGESSGATSYHLRQLARHGLIRDRAGLGRGRERWWEPVPGAINVDLARDATPAERAATETVLSEFFVLRVAELRDFLLRNDEFDDDWGQAGMVSTVSVRLTLDQHRELKARQAALVEEFRERYGVHRPSSPGARTVQVLVAAIPVLADEAGDGRSR